MSMRIWAWVLTPPWLLAGQPLLLLLLRSRGLVLVASLWVLRRAASMSASLRGGSRHREERVLPRGDRTFLRPPLRLLFRIS
jgi:hypothetical protein